MSFRLSFSLILVLDSRISLVLFFFIFSLLLFLSFSSFLYFLPLRSSHLLYLPLSPPPGSFSFLLSFPFSFSSSSLISCCSTSSFLLFLPSTSHTNHHKRIKDNEKRQRKMREQRTVTQPHPPLNKRTNKHTNKTKHPSKTTELPPKNKQILKIPQRKH